MSRPIVVAGMTALCVGLTGCSGTSAPISSGAGNTLRADVLALTKAAAAHQWSTADQALAQLRSDLTAAIAAGSLSTDRAQAIRQDVAVVASDLAARRVAENPPASSTSPRPAPKPQPKPKPEPNPRPNPRPKPPKPPHGHGHDHGPGHGGEDGGD